MTLLCNTTVGFFWNYLLCEYGTSIWIEFSSSLLLLFEYHFLLMSYAVLYVIQYFAPLVIEYPFCFLDSVPSNLLSLFSQGRSGPKEKSTRPLVPFLPGLLTELLDPPSFLKCFPKKTNWPGQPAGLPSPSMAPHYCPPRCRLIRAGDHLGWRCSPGQRSTTHPPPTIHICACKTLLPPPLWSWLETLSIGH